MAVHYENPVMNMYEVGQDKHELFPQKSQRKKEPKLRKQLAKLFSNPQDGSFILSRLSPMLNLYAQAGSFPHIQDAIYKNLHARLDNMLKKMNDLESECKDLAKKLRHVEHARVKERIMECESKVERERLETERERDRAVSAENEVKRLKSDIEEARTIDRLAGLHDRGRITEVRYVQRDPGDVLESNSRHQNEESHFANNEKVLRNILILDTENKERKWREAKIYG